MDARITRAFLLSAEALPPQEILFSLSRSTPFTYSIQQTPLGRLFVLLAGDLLCGVGFVECHSAEEMLATMVKPWGVKAQQDAERAQPVIKQILAYNYEALPVLMRGTAFQMSVWQALTMTQRGETLSYQALAERAQCPKAVRAVANAVGANRLGYIVPCHRVIRANGQLGGFEWGAACKERLLAAESLPLGAYEGNFSEASVKRTKLGHTD